jgi:hypothetical protein
VENEWKRKRDRRMDRVRKIMRMRWEREREKERKREREKERKREREKERKKKWIGRERKSELYRYK